MLFCTLASVRIKKTGPMWYDTDTILIDTMVVFTLMIKASDTLEIGTMLSFNSLINLIGKRFVFRECRILHLSRRLRKTRRGGTRSD